MGPHCAIFTEEKKKLAKIHSAKGDLLRPLGQTASSGVLRRNQFTLKEKVT